MKIANTPATPLDLAQFEGHTPGPWTVRDETNQPRGMLEVRGPQHEKICGFPYMSGALKPRENAAAIAQLPALLAECLRQRKENARLESLWASYDGSVRAANAERDALLAECKRQREQIAELVAALRTNQNWLSSYPGGGATKAWARTHALLAKLEGTETTKETTA